MSRFFSPRRSPGSVHLIVSVLLAVSLAFPALAASGPGLRAERGVVVSADGEASRAGVEVLRSGGNAVDASVATALALAVTYPLAGNLGGGGFMLYRSSTGEYLAMDFRETAPKALTSEMFLGKDGKPDGSKSLERGLAVGVPGTVAGLHEAQRRWGKLEWRQVVAPAIRLAAEGFAVPHHLAQSMADNAQKFQANAASAEIFLPAGKTRPAGSLFKQPDLAESLRRISRKGPKGFYSGPIARALVAGVQEAGGVMTLNDLEVYRPLERSPLVGSYRGHKIVSFPPPSSGGVALFQILGMLERFELSKSGPYDSLTVHRVAEAERRAFADRSRWLGDPDFVSMPLEELIAPDYLRFRSSSIDDGAASPSERLRPGNPLPVEQGETLHLSVADASGGTVSMTATLNASYGNGMVAPGTGILLNNEIDDFSIFPDVPNTYGLVGGKANSVVGGKRPLSSMTPTIVEQKQPGPRPMLVLGSPGGSTIITSVAQVIMRVIDHEMPLQAAVDSARFHHQWLPDRIWHEDGAFPSDVSESLRKRGHTLVVAPRPIGSVNALGLNEEGWWIGVADPRRESVAAGY